MNNRRTVRTDDIAARVDIAANLRQDSNPVALMMPSSRVRATVAPANVRSLRVTSRTDRLRQRCFASYGCRMDGAESVAGRGDGAFAEFQAVAMFLIGVACLAPLGLGVMWSLQTPACTPALEMLAEPCGSPWGTLLGMGVFLAPLTLGGLFFLGLGFKLSSQVASAGSPASDR